MKHSNTFKLELTKFCYIPFHGFCIDPQGWLTMCCMDPRKEVIWEMDGKKGGFPRMYERPHIDDVEDLQKWWIDTYEVVWQKYFDKEQHTITPCAKCFSNKNVSLHYSKKRTVKESYDSNMKNGRIKWEFDFIDPKVRWLEYTTSNICNQMCVMCSGRCSTKWLDFDEMFGHPKMKLQKLSASAINKIKKLIPDLSVLVVKGGEPLADMGNMEILEYASEVNPNIDIHMTTNLQGLTKRHIRIFKKFKELTLNVSVDGTHDIYNWIRGGDFNKAVNNMKTLYEETGHRITPSTTVSIYNFFNLEDILDFFHGKDYVRWMHYYNIVSWPRWCSIFYVPNSILRPYLDKYKNFKIKYPRSNAGPLMSVSGQIDKDITQQAEKYTHTMNSIRKFDILDHVPKLKELFNY